MNQEITNILEAVRNGSLSVEDAAGRLKETSYVDLGYAKPDLHRKIRQGVSEVIYGEGKTAGQIIGILTAMKEHGQDRVLITRISKEKALRIKEEMPIRYDEASKIGLLGEKPEPDGNGKILIATGGTSDIPVAQEAAITAEMLGNEVIRLYDVGVAGVHRLLDNAELLMQANVIIAVAGMEGALASVVGGIADVPVIAVPTSVGYGASFHGLSALLSMLNSCAAGVSVVNIDNGFGAGFLASRINHLKPEKGTVRKEKR